MYKPTILFSSESSFLATGFATQSREMLRRLYDSQKFRVVELGQYGHSSQPQAQELPWEYIGNLPNPNDQEELARYNSDPINQFNKFRFEEACLKYKPDIVIDIKDYWYMQYQNYSPFRQLFKLLWCPTLDSHPLQEKWVGDYIMCDAIFGYSNWGLNLLKKESSGKAKIVDFVCTGCDLQKFTPVKDKAKHKKLFGIEEDSFVIGTVMRNQKRKLFPDLIESFAKLLGRSDNKNIYLYLHTTYPDVGYQIPYHIKRSGVSHRIIMTYVCDSCHSFWPSVFVGARTHCHKCGHPSAGLININNTFVPEYILHVIYNLFDVYVQYSTNEGLGLPAVEAAACGIPILVVDYSAMSDVAEKLSGWKIKVKQLVFESETQAYKAVPDNDHFIQLLLEIINMPSEMLLNKSLKARFGAEKHFNWDTNMNKLIEYIDGLNITESLWGAPSRLHKPADSVPLNTSNVEFIDYLFDKVLGRPEYKSSYLAARMSQDLSYGFSLENFGGMCYNDMGLVSTRSKISKFRSEQEARQFLYSEVLRWANQNNFWEEKRVRNFK